MEIESSLKCGTTTKRSLIIMTVSMISKVRFQQNFTFKENFPPVKVNLSNSQIKETRKQHVNFYHQSYLWSTKWSERTTFIFHIILSCSIILYILIWFFYFHFLDISAITSVKFYQVSKNSNVLKLSIKDQC